MALLRLFRPRNIIDRASSKCAKADMGLMVEFLMFARSHEAAGANLTMTEDDLQYLDKVVSEVASKLGPEEAQLTYRGAAVYYGTLVVETLGGKWTRSKHNGFIVTGIGKHKIGINPYETIYEVANSKGARTIASEYAALKNARN